jgi:hypothetical protein
MAYTLGRAGSCKRLSTSVGVYLNGMGYLPVRLTGVSSQTPPHSGGGFSLADLARYLRQPNLANTSPLRWGFLKIGYDIAEC